MKMKTFMRFYYISSRILFSMKGLIHISKNRQIIKTQLPSWNVYHQDIQMKQFSLEHIIPQRLFIYPNHSYDLDNLVSCEKDWNSFRSDFRYGIGKTPFIKNSFCGSLYPHERIFQPSPRADYGLISRSIIKMLHRYPYLYRVLDQIIEQPYLLDEWSRYPCLSYETLRNEIKTVYE